MPNQPSRLSVDTVEPRRLALRGDLDAHTAPQLEDRLGALGADAPVQLVMAEVAFMDSSGIRAIVDAHGTHADAGSRLELVEPSEAVLRLLEITGLTDVLHLDR